MFDERIDEVIGFFLFVNSGISEHTFNIAAIGESDILIDSFATRRCDKSANQYPGLASVISLVANYSVESPDDRGLHAGPELASVGDYCT